MADFEKRCAVCGEVYDLGAFRRLPLKGVQTFDDADPTRLEFRDCGCGNTLAIDIDRNGNPIVP